MPTLAPFSTVEQSIDVDILEANLEIAEGLPGFETSIGHCLNTAETWVDRVRETTARYMSNFPRVSAEFDGSEAKFRVACMITGGV